MRKAVPFALILSLACSTTPPPSPPTTAPAVTADTQYGMTVEEEAQILALEDRRHFDPSIISRWVTHENPLHRVRIAMALGRIGPHTFIDTNNNRFYDPPAEKQGGIEELGKLASDPDRRVREAVAFAVGEIGDVQGSGTLFYLTTDADAGVAAEAVEGLAKLATNKEWVRDNWARFYLLTREPFPAGVRARATRFLFRFDTDVASTAAMANLGDASEAIRQEAAYALARRPFEPAREQLELVMNDRNVLTRAYAASALGRIGAATSMPLIVAALGDAHPWVRTNAAIAAGRLAEKSRAVLRAEDLPRIFAVTEDPDPGVRSSIIDIVGYYAESNDTARQRLLDTLRNGTQWERELAAGAIAKHFAPDSEIARTMGDDISPWARVRVIEATATKPHGSAIRAKYANAPDALVRAAVMNAIPDEAADAEVELIRKGIADSDVVVRATAIGKYGKLKSAEAPNTILRTLGTAEERERTETLNDARLAAIDAIAGIEFNERGSFLRSLLADKDPVVRRVAAEAIRTHYERLPAYTPFPETRTAAEYQEIVQWSRQPHTATIHMTRGVIDLVLLTQDAPLTTWNFAQLAKKKYFDNSSFMRVVPNFVIQGGDPRNDMSGGPGYAIRDEINLQKYTRGAVGMALSGPDTGGSQFFVTHSAQPHLDGGYTIFGRVYDGMNSVVDQTERGDRVTTIAVDEKAAPGAEAGGVANVSLPLEVGRTTAERLLARVPEYEDARSKYTPDISVIEMMKSYVRAGDRMEVYMGTWCPDSVREVPKFLRIAEDLKSQFGVELPATFVAVDRAKQQPAALIAGKDIQKIATFIYYRGDRELGRIVERPTALFEDDLLAIVAKD